jgi:hypothetical protein
MYAESEEDALKRGDWSKLGKTHEKGRNSPYASNKS